MTGKRSGRHGEKQCYRVARGQRFPRTNGIFNRAINATALHTEILRVLREVLLNKAGLNDALRRAVEIHAQKQQPTDDLPQLEKLLTKKQRQIAAALESLIGDAELDRPIDMKLAEYRAEVQRLTALRSAPRPSEPIDIEASIEHLASQLADFGANLDDKEKAILHEMFGLLVHRMEADLLTKEIDVVLALPESIGSEISSNGTLGLVRAFACKTQNETHHQNAVILAEYLCTAKGHRHVCYDCRRQKRA